MQTGWTVTLSWKHTARAVVLLFSLVWPTLQQDEGRDALGSKKNVDEALSLAFGTRGVINLHVENSETKGRNEFAY